MRGDIINSIRWEEVNDCGTFQKGGKRKVKLYGEVVEDLEFDNKIEAEQWLYKYYRAKNKGNLLYENEYEEDEIEDNPDKKPKIYFSGKTSDKNFSIFREAVENLLNYFSNPTLKEIEKKDKFVVFFNEGISYVIRGNDIIIKDEIKVNPKDYYPKDYKKGDPIPADTVNKMLADKLGIDWRLLKYALNLNSDFYCKEKEEYYKEKVFKLKK